MVRVLGVCAVVLGLAVAVYADWSPLPGWQAEQLDTLGDLTVQMITHTVEVESEPADSVLVMVFRRQPRHLHLGLPHDYIEPVRFVTDGPIAPEVHIDTGELLDELHPELGNRIIIAPIDVDPSGYGGVATLTGIDRIPADSGWIAFVNAVVVDELGPVNLSTGGPQPAERLAHMPFAIQRHE